MERSVGSSIASCEKEPLRLAFHQMNASDVQQHNYQNAMALFDRDSRVKVYTIGGLQIGVPSVGEGEHNRLTFPRCFLVKDALKMSWIRFSSPEENADDHLAGRPKRCYRPFTAFQPQSLVHSNGMHAGGNDGDSGPRHIPHPLDRCAVCRCLWNQDTTYS